MIPFHIQAQGAAAILAALIESGNPITDLDLSGNQILATSSDGWFSDPSCGAGGFGTERARTNVLDGLGRLLASRTTLKRLGLAENDLGDSGLSTVARAAQSALSLVELDVSRNAGTVDKRTWMTKSGPELGRLLSISTSLTTLNLQWNTLSGPGAIDIARSLLHNTTLIRLNLGWNCFGKNSAIDCLGESLAGVEAGRGHGKLLDEGICRLQELDLSFNSITDRKVLHFAECISYNTRLKLLRLDGNPLLMSGVAAMRRVNQVVDDFKTPLILSMESCGAESQVPDAFDVMHPAGTYALDLSLEYDRVVVRKLVQITLSGEGEFILPSITLNQKPFQLVLMKTSSKQHRNSLVIGKDTESLLIPSGEHDKKRVALRVIASMRQSKTQAMGEKSILMPGTNLPLFGILRFDFGEITKPPVRFKFVLAKNCRFFRIIISLMAQTDEETIPDTLLQLAFKS